MYTYRPTMNKSLVDVYRFVYKVRRKLWSRTSQVIGTESPITPERDIPQKMDIRETNQDSQKGRLHSGYETGYQTIS